MQGQEKRGFPRYPVTLTAHYRIGNRYSREPIGDLSRGGLYLKTREPAREGAQVRMALALPWSDGPRYCTLSGTVARLDRDARGYLKGVGVSIDDKALASVDRDLLGGYLGQLADPAA